MPITTVLITALLAVSPTGNDHLRPVPEANHKAAGIVAPNVLSRDLVQSIVAQGAMPVENPEVVDPATGTTAKYYGYLSNGPMVPAPGAVQAPGANVEANKTEPDKNTYLVVGDQHGADDDYDYGTHFLYQGHEAGRGYITRVNLDADEAHRVTVLATTDTSSNPLPVFDGSTWNPFAERLLFSAELGANGGIWQATLDFPSQVEDISGATGRGGYEGIQTDITGQVLIVEDVGGPTGAVNTHARQPNSFVYRFVPDNPSDLKHGKLQALQVMSLAHAGPIEFHAGQADADILSQDVKDLHTYGKVFTTHWVTVHDTAVDGDAPFNANALAKSHHATPFKRPENAMFRPGTFFTQFAFTETGDTSALTEAGSTYGGFGALISVTQQTPRSDSGKLRLVYRGDVVHTGFDNLAFWSRDEVAVVEDAGDGLHTQRDALDSMWLIDVTANYANPQHQPLRILAQGRDSSATVDSSLLAGGNGFQNDGDNELTGLHVSDGDPGAFGLLGARIPRPFDHGWRVFYTQQHGDNQTWEILTTRTPATPTTGTTTASRSRPPSPPWAAAASFPKKAPTCGPRAPPPLPFGGALDGTGRPNPTEGSNEVSLPGVWQRGRMERPHR